MPIDLSSESIGSTVSVTLADADKAYKVTVPRKCGSVILTPKVNQAQFAYSGTDGADLADVSHDLFAGSTTEWAIDAPYTSALPGSALGSFYLQTANAGSVVTVSLRPETGAYGSNA